MNSRDNLQGLRRLTRSFSVLNHVEHPKDFIAVSGLLGESMEAFMKEGLLHQTFRLLEITTDENCLFEVWKIIYYLFNMLKFKNEKFDFRKVLLRQNCNELLLSKDTLSGLCLLALGTPNSNILTLVLILVNLVKYTDDLFLETLNPGLLERLLSHLGNAPGPQLSSALSLLAYSLCLKREAIASSEMVEVLLRASTVMMETPGQVEVFIYGIRIYSRLMNSTSQDVYYFNVINKVRGLLNPKENNVLQIECLKMLRSACTVDKYIPSVAHEKQLMDFIYSKVFQGDSSLSRVCSQIVCNISLSSYKQSLDCLQILKNLEAKKYSMNLMDMLICLKSLISEERILDLLLSNNLVGALVDCASHYRIDKHVLLTEAYVPETAFVCLCFDILFIVMNRSKDHRENQATWSQGSVKDQRLALAKLDSLSLVLEYVCLDKKVFCRSLSNALILKICNNSLLVNVSGVLGILKSVYTSLRMFDHVGTVDTIDAKLREVFNEHYESIEKSDRKYTITFKVYSIFDFPNGDNRIFTIEGIHSFKDLFDHIYDRYKYLGDIMISFKDTYDNNMITLDSDQVYDKLLYQVFRDDNNLHKKADISLFVRSTSQRFDQSNNPFVASRDNQRGRRFSFCRGQVQYLPEVLHEERTYKLQRRDQVRILSLQPNKQQVVLMNLSHWNLLLHSFVQFCLLNLIAEVAPRLLLLFGPSFDLILGSPQSRLPLETFPHLDPLLWVWGLRTAKLLICPLKIHQKPP